MVSTKEKKVYQWLPVLLGLAMGLTPLLGVLSLQYLEIQLIHATGDSLALAADNIAEKLDRKMFDHFENVQLIALALPIQQQDPTAIWSYLNAIDQNLSIYDWLEVTDARGRVISSTDLKIVGKDRSQATWFQDAHELGFPSVRDATLSEKYSNVMEVVFSAPIISPDKTFVGAVAIHVGLLGLQHFFDRPIKILQAKHGKGTIIEWQFLNKNGLVLVDSILGEESRVNLRDLGLPSAQLSIGNQTGYIEERHPRRNIDVVTGFAKTRGWLSMPNPNWTVLFRMERGPILIPIVGTMQKVAGIGSLMILPLLGFLVWALRRLRLERSLLEERYHLYEFEMRIGHQLSKQDTLQSMLQGCSEIMVEFLDAAFTRIWTLNQTGTTLELQASAGLYTHLNGPHGSIPVGQYKIGTIAKLRKPHLTNQVIGDPNVPEQEWAKREGMVAFAGYPLTVDDKLMGVMAMFAKHKLSETPLKTMELVAEHIAQAIARKHVERHNRELAAHNKLLLESAAWGIFGLDMNGLATFMNPAAGRMLGYEPQELMGTPMLANIHHAKPDGSSYPPEKCPIHATFNEGSVCHVNDEVFWRSDGTYFFVEYTSTPMHDQQGVQIGAVVAFSDITERKRADKELHLKTRDLETLLYVVSHDLNEPLRSIQNFSQIVLDHQRDNLDSKAQDYLRRVILGAERMSKLLAEILSLSRAQRLNLPQQEVQTNDMIKDSLTRLQKRREETHATIIVAPDLPNFRVDPTWGTQAIYNLLANALKYTRDGQAPEVEILPYDGQGKYPGEVGLVVRDRGPGVNPVHAERIFQIFQRAVGREIEGTGAGLAIVRQVAERHGGHAWVEPREGGGAAFFITFGSAISASKEVVDVH